MNQLIDLSVRDLLDTLASSEPAPGGGSASALAGALGAALLMMVAGLPKTRHGSDEDREALREAAGAARIVRDELAALVDRDTEAYRGVVAAYRMPKGTDEEKRARTAAIQAALAGAIETPLGVMRQAARGAETAVLVARHANPSASSDVGVALALFEAALQGGRLNVEINLGSLKDAARAERVRAEVERLAGDAAAHAAGARTALAST